MRQRRGLYLRTLSKILCIVLSLCLLFASVPTVFAEDEQIQLNPLQKALLRAMELDDAQKADFVRDILGPLDGTQDVEDVTDELVEEAKEYFPTISEEDIRVALENYVVINKKEEVKDAILTIDLSRELNRVTGFENIAKKINYQATGDENDMRGLTLLIEILNKVQQNLPDDSNGVIVIDDPADTSKIKFSIPAVLLDAVKAKANALLPHIETLYNKIKDYDGEDAFEKLLNYAESIANSFDAQEVAAFKEFLAANGGIYKGQASDLNPLQVVLLRAMTMTKQQKQAFINKVLVPLDDNGEVTSDVIDAAKDFFPTVSMDDIILGLEKYAKIGQDKKDALKDAILNIDLSRELSSVTGFLGILEEINYQATGDKEDMRGLVLMVEILNRIQEQLPPDSEGNIVIDDPADRSKLKFKIPGVLQEAIRKHVNALLPHIETLYNKVKNYEGKDEFEKLLNYAESTANSFGADEVAAFKLFLYANGGIYVPESMFDIEASFAIDGKAATELKNNGILSADVEVYNKSDKAVDALVIVALYKIGEGMETMEKISCNSKNVLPEATVKITGGFRLPEDVTGYEVRAFVWEGTDIEDSNLKPLSGIKTIPDNK